MANREQTPGQAGIRRALERTSRRSAISAVVFLVVAVMAAAVAVGLLLQYLEARTADRVMPMAKVVVAARALPLGTTLTAEMLQVVQWPAEALPVGAIDEAEGLVGRVLMSNVVPNEPIVEPKLASPDGGHGLAAVLPEGALAVAVRVNDVVGVAGFIHPGDKVDVIVTMRPREESNTPPVSKIILQNIQVLAVGKQVDAQEAGGGKVKPIPATVATLMVNAEQAEHLALASARGNLLLALRNRLYTEELETAGIIPEKLLGTIQERPAARPSRTTAATRAHAAPSRPIEDKKTIEILRGDRFEKRQFKEGENAQ